MDALKEKVKFDIKKLPEPIEVDKTTFSGLKREFSKINQKKKPWGFGVG